MSSTDDVYLTDPRAASPLCRRLPSLCYYTRLAGIVYGASRKAKQGRLSDDAWVVASWRVVEALERVGVRLAIEGVEHLRNNPGPWVMVGNHMSTLETFVLPALVLPHSPLTFVVKRSLVEYPIFRHVMISRKPILVDRVNPRDDFKVVIEEGQARLASGMSVVVFPQTTRTPRFDPEEFNSIGVKLAKRAGVPVLPVALKTDAWGNGRLIKDCGRIDPEKTVHMAFGAPLEVSGNGQATQDAVVSFIQDKLRQWGG
ncbi:lysophospholipid acyltransferase family protein [Geoalkalibacter halelectricus]|uniref:1-acyl-sn-glycerol-3-phosphate acyltransferase n=1 Tax=Geoalkalibacter halelectricus TaxID=2847045 RepID=A0ABY5ZR27_9BACT|nr:lysophospholipid acyltransferase family protein [Geoalkalibacter halelectricus]MDO3378707.1 1-acyl-sn-glycerol-3-phosphate acyltransferase [Geoalkalibacter halelectricus]UWZ81630.1 1-acyl-sn-glycerol-3-phosphate acyltransferase [Geoalkalibacter halelectricus]